MKKIFSLLLCLTLSVVCLSCAFAEEGELGVIPYTIQALDDTIYIPENMTVTKETESDAGVSLTIALNGRTDCGYSIDISYSEAYEGYSMLTMPDELRQEIIDFYAQNYPGESTPTIAEFEDEYADFSPLIASGKGSDGNQYCIYVTVYDGFILTVSGAIAADEFDLDSYSALYLLYWQTLDMLIE